MATGKKTGGRDFQPGKSGNPAGRPPLPADLKAIKKLSADFVRATIAKLSSLNIPELKSLVESRETPALEAAVASVYYKAVAQGDYKRLDFLFDRSIGKVKEDVHLDIGPIEYVTSLKPDGRIIQEVINPAELVGAGAITNSKAEDDRASQPEAGADNESVPVSKA